MLASVSGWSGPSLDFLHRQSLLVERQSTVELTGRRIAPSEVVHAGECVGVVGAELRLRQRQRLLEQRQGTVELTGLPVADQRGCSCSASVSGWSGPSFAF